MKYKYYNGEEKSPYPENDARSHFWWGEMMFENSHQSIDEWKELGIDWLKSANNEIKQLADKYTLEQFGLITYISCLFGKWCPYDNQEWILEY